MHRKLFDLDGCDGKYFEQTKCIYVKDYSNAN